MTDRATFMARVRQSLTDVQADQPIDFRREIETLVRRTTSDDDVVGQFVSMATEAGMSVVSTRASDLGPALREAVGTRTSPVIAVANDALRASIHDAIADLAPRDAVDLEQLFASGVAITDAHLAIAETGTLIVRTMSGTPRGAPVIAPHHIAIVRTSQVVPDLIDGLVEVQEIASKDGSSVVVMITGPSKTADIEGILVTGVHGPATVTVLLLAD